MSSIEATAVSHRGQDARRVLQDTGNFPVSYDTHPGQQSHGEAVLWAKQQDASNLSPGSLREQILKRRYAAASRAEQRNFDLFLRFPQENAVRETAGHTDTMHETAAKEGEADAAGGREELQAEEASPDTLPQNNAAPARDGTGNAEQPAEEPVWEAPAGNTEVAVLVAEAVNLRLQMLKVLRSSAEIPTKRPFDIRLMTVREPPKIRFAVQEDEAEAVLPQPEAAPDTAATPAPVGPAFSSVLPALGGLGETVGVTPVEGVPEREWRVTTASPAAKPWAHATPIEGVPEREWPVAPKSGKRKMAAASGPRTMDLEQEPDHWDPLSPLVMKGMNAAPSIAAQPVVSPRSADASSDEENTGVGEWDYDDDENHPEEEVCLPIDGNPTPGTAEPSPRQRQPDASAGDQAMTDAEPLRPGNSPAPQATGSQAAFDAASLQPAEPPVHEEEGEQDEDCDEKGGRGGRPRTKDINQRLRQMYRERKSLCGMGMHTDDGKRRSTRQRRRPLEWWRQECKVYKREHASLPTVDHVIVHTPNSIWRTVNPEKRARTKNHQEE